jgi:uncharacterized protein YjiS (DUF1127 family)
MPCADCLPGTFTPRFARVGRGIARAVQTAWRAYWRRRAERATVFVLQSLDARTLKDIGIDRSEVESVVRGACGSRRRASRAHPSSQSERCEP